MPNASAREGGAARTEGVSPCDFARGSDRLALGEGHLPDYQQCAKKRRSSGHCLLALTLVLATVASCADKKKRRTNDDDQPRANRSSQAANASRGGPFTWDGFKLGDTYSTVVMAREPYAHPCDDDELEQSTRRAMVYGAKPCRREAFPDGTTVLFFIKYAPTLDFATPIEAFAWLGGTYFDKRSTFPLWAGAPIDLADKELGPPKRTFDIDRNERKLTVREHEGKVFTIADGDVVAGFAVGPMPEDPKAESWDAISQMYAKYTDKPASRRQR